MSDDAESALERLSSEEHGSVAERAAEAKPSLETMRGVVVEREDDHKKDRAPMLANDEMSDNWGLETPRNGDEGERYNGEGGEGGKDDDEVANSEPMTAALITKSLHGVELRGAIIAETRGNVTGLISSVGMATVTWTMGGRQLRFLLRFELKTSHSERP